MKAPKAKSPTDSPSPVPVVKLAQTGLVHTFGAMFPRHPSRLAPLLAAACALTSLSASPSYFAHLQLEKSTVEITTITDGLDAPIDVAWGPDSHLWCTQLDGTVWRINPTTGGRDEILSLADRIFHRRSHGLFSLALHPHFANEPWVYLHYIYKLPPVGLEETVRSRVVRARWDGARLGEPETILDNIPGSSFHNGSRLVFGPDGRLYVTTGDAGNTKSSQDPAALSGKVLRLNPDGTIPADNPTPGSPVWTSGHRNAQGLVFAANGRVYASEHGPNNDDEINLLEPGRNYGWPIIEGFTDKPGEIESARGKNFTDPLRAWTPTIAAAGLAYYDHPAIPEWRNTLLLANLKGRALRVLELNPGGEKIERERIFLQERLGRIRDVCVTPDGDIYLITSNTDWHPRFQTWMYDGLPTGPDRILRLRRADKTTLARLAATPTATAWQEDLKPLPLQSERGVPPATTAELQAGQNLYQLHCAACHAPNGLGAPGLLPPLASTVWVTGQKQRLIQVVLAGLAGRIEVNGEFYNQEMPSFRHLPDEDIAAILTYIRASFGNKASAVRTNEVVEERRGLK